MRLFVSLLSFFRHRYPSAERLGVPVARWRQSIYRTVFETNTPLGKQFEKYLTLAIVLSLGVVIAHSVPSIAQGWRVYALRSLEWLFTLAFTLEYGLRLVSVRRPWRYALSFYGIVDLLAIAPAYLAVIYPEAQFMAAIRALRLVRTFHVFPILRGFLDEYLMLGRALRSSARKIFVFLSVVALIVFVMGSLIFVIEGPSNGFTSVPMGVYWAISTVTTVGYGDLTPSTSIGRFFSSIMMLLGWGVLAVPTGLVGVELSRSAGTKAAMKGVGCERCGENRHEEDARFCRRCGQRLQLPGSRPRPDLDAGSTEPVEAPWAPQPATPEPATPEPAAPQPGAPQPGAPQPSTTSATV